MNAQIAINWSVPREDRVRISRQCVRLLDALKRGPVTNVEMVTELRCLNATARCSELRQAGYDIRAERTKEPGIWRYTLAVAK